MQSFHFGHGFGNAGGRTRRPQRGADLQTRLRISFADAMKGITHRMDLSGTGAGGPSQVEVRIPAGVDTGQHLRLGWGDTWIGFHRNFRQDPAPSAALQH